MKKCIDCKEVKSFDNFHKATQRADGFAIVCKPCKAKRDKEYHWKNRDRILSHKRSPEVVNRRRAGRYNLTVKQLETLIEKSNGICGICKTRPATDVDHCHKTGRVRGMLCKPCNSTLGYMQDNVEWLANAITYLK